MIFILEFTKVRSFFLKTCNYHNFLNSPSILLYSTEMQNITTNFCLNFGRWNRLFNCGSLAALIRMARFTIFRTSSARSATLEDTS